MSSNANSITITVFCGRNIGKTKIDTFVVIQLDKVKFRTSVASKSTDPTWNEECEFVLKNKFAVLSLTVYHKTTFFDEFIGQIRLPLDEIHELYDKRPRSCWYPLKGKTGKKDEHKYIGELSVRLEFAYKVENLEVPVSDRFDSLSLSSQKTNNLRGLKMAVKKTLGHKNIDHSREKMHNFYSQAEKISNFAAGGISLKIPVPKSSTLPSFNRASSYSGQIPEEKEVLPNDLPIIKPDLVPDYEILNVTNEVEADDIVKSTTTNHFAEDFLSAPINDNYWKRMSSFGKAGGYNPDLTFESMSKMELLDTVKKQRLEVSRCLKRIRDLEEYIDQLTLRVLDAQPDLLLGPFSRASSARYQVYKS